MKQKAFCLLLFAMAGVAGVSAQMQPSPGIPRSRSFASQVSTARPLASLSDFAPCLNVIGLRRRPLAGADSRKAPVGHRVHHHAQGTMIVVAQGFEGRASALFRISRASCSMERPFVAARILSLRFVEMGRRDGTAAIRLDGEIRRVVAGNHDPLVNGVVDRKYQDHRQQADPDSEQTVDFDASH